MDDYNQILNAISEEKAIDDQPEERMAREIWLAGEEQQSFIHEDENEMAPWFHYSLDESFDRETYTDLPCFARLSPLPTMDIAPLTSGITSSPKPNYLHSSCSPPINTMIEPPVVEKELTLVSPPSYFVASLEPPNALPDKGDNLVGRVKERKQKATNPENSKRCRSENMRSKAAEDKRQRRRPRVAESRNLLERRCRDRINVKINTLKELIPGCKKSDQASILQAAIEYMKFLQLQIQMMSMGCGMIPMMYPAMQQYHCPAWGISMNQPTVPYPTIETVGHNPSQPETPSLASASQQFFGLQEQQISASQNRESKDINNPENQKTGSEFL